MSSSSNPNPETPPTLYKHIMYPEFKDKVVLLTSIGQSTSSNKNIWGNGAATALTLAQNGAKIFGCDLRLPAAEHTQNILRSSGRICDVITADITREEDVKALVDACLAKHGRIDVLINNVGVSEPGGPVELMPEVWDRQLDVNLKSTYFCCHFVLPVMERQGSGVVVNIASFAGMRFIGKPQVAYSAAKAGVVQFTKVTAVLYARKGIRMNFVAPGLMHTPMIDMLAEKFANGDIEGLIKKRHAAVPMGRMGDGFDVANAVVFLASDQARYITGQKLVVDGGITSQT